MSHLSAWLYDVLAARMNDPDGAAVLTELNNIVRARGFEAITTAVVATTHRDQGRLASNYAGHPPLLLGKPGAGWTALDVGAGTSPSNLPLGVIAGAQFTQGTVRVDPGDRIFLHTMDTYGHLFDGADQDSAAKMEKLFGPDRKVVQMAARRAS